MNRRFFLRKRVLVPLGTGVALMLLAWFVLLPWVVRSRVRAVLHQLKLDDATFRVTRATPWSSTVRDIDAGDGNHIHVLRVSYSVEGLWNRRVDNILVEGLQLTADVRAGGASIKPLEAMMHAAPASQPAVDVAEESAAADASASDWPFRSVRVVDSVLIVRTPQRAFEVPFEGTLCWPQLHAEVGGLTVDGAIGDPNAIDVRFAGEGVDGAGLTTVVRAVLPDAPLAIAGDVAVNGSLQRTGGVTKFLSTVTAAAADEAATNADETDKIAGTNVTLEGGVFRIAGTMGGESRSVQVTANDGTLAEASMGVRATGVSADVVWDSPPRATTRPTQVVRIGRLSASKVELTDAVVRFAFAPEGAVHVRDAQANLLGGVVSVQDVPIIPGQPVPLTLVAANVELAELLKLLAQGKAAGEGKVNGRLPLVVAPDGSVQLAEGGAEATAGGTLRVTDEAALQSIAGGTAAGSANAAAPQAQVRQNVVQALKDFQYESLTAQLKHDPDKGLVAYVRMTGKGRTGAKQALDYDLRVTGLNDLLRSALGVHRTVTREAARQ